MSKGRSSKNRSCVGKGELETRRNTEMEKNVRKGRENEGEKEDK